MDMTQLQYFKMIAECGSLTKAARQLHVSQPAMSAMLKKLERELGVELFDRSANRIHLNQTGEIALIHVNHILKSMEKMREDLLSAAKHHASLSIAFCDPGVRWFCVPRLSVFCPELQIHDELYEGGAYAELLREREFDVAVSPGKIEDEGVICRPFLKDRVFLSVPCDSRLRNFASISLKDIPSQPLLYPQIGGHFLRQIEKVISEQKLPITLVKNDYNITQHLIRTTNFLATISTLSMDLRNDGTHRTVIPMDDAELNVVYYISFLKGNEGRVRRFLEWAKAVKQEFESIQ